MAIYLSSGRDSLGLRKSSQKSEDNWVSAYRNMEVVGQNVGTGRPGENVRVMIWNCLVCSLNGQFSGMCGGT
jgi:hypothetical protein